jgi:hypothetical protein
VDVWAQKSTKTESSAINAYQKPDDDSFLDTVKNTIHTGWYVYGTQESKTQSSEAAQS